MIKNSFITSIKYNNILLATNFCSESAKDVITVETLTLKKASTFLELIINSYITQFIYFYFIHRKLLKIVETKRPLNVLEVDQLQELELLWASYFEKVYLLYQILYDFLTSKFFILCYMLTFGLSKFSID